MSGTPGSRLFRGRIALVGVVGKLGLQGGRRNSGAIAKPRFIGELGSTDAEEDAIVAFLGTLSDGCKPDSQSSLACALSASFHQCYASICSLAWKAVACSLMSWREGKHDLHPSRVQEIIIAPVSASERADCPRDC